MADIFSIEKRSEIMRSVRSKNNKSTEQKMISIFQELSIHGWRRNYKVIGHPDFVFPKLRIAIFMDGCFWHGHNCRNLKPNVNQMYWDKKIGKNMERDRTITDRFRKRGWKVIRIWECELKRTRRDELYKKLEPLICETGIWKSIGGELIH